MSQKELTAKVKLNISDAESKLKKLDSLIKSINRTTQSSTKVENGVTKTIAQYDKLAMQQRKIEQNDQRIAIKQEALALQKEKWATQQSLIAQRQAEKEQRILDRKMAQEESARLKTQKQAEKEQMILNKKIAAQQKALLQAQRVNQEWRKAHPILTKIGDRLNVNKDRTMAWGNSVTSSISKMNANLKRSNTALDTMWGKLKGIAATYLGIMGGRAIIDSTDILTSSQNRMNYVNAKSMGDSGFNSDGSYSAKTLNATQESLDKMYASSQKVRTSYQDMISNVSRNMTLAGDAFDNNIDYAIRFQEIMSEAYAVGGASAAEMHSSMYQLTQALGSGILQGDELRSVREGAPLAYKAIEEFAQGVLNTDESLKQLASDGKITAEMVVAGIMNMGESVDTAFEQTTQTFGQTFDQIRNSALYAFQPVMNQLTEMLNRAIDNGLIQRFETFFTQIYKIIMIAFRAIEIGISWIADNWNWLQYIFYAGVAACVTYLLLLASTAIWTAITSFVTFLAANPFIVWIMFIGLLIAALVWLLNACSNTCEFIIQVCWMVAYAILAILAVVLVAYLATGAVIMSVPMMIALVIIGVLALLIAAFVKWTGQIVGFAYGLYDAIGAICTNIGLFWENMLDGMKQLFWEFVDSVIDNFRPIFEAVNKLLEAMDKPTIDLDFAEKRATELSTKIGYVSVGDAFNEGYARGNEVGQGIQDKINGFGEKLKGYLNGDDKSEDESKDKLSVLDEIGNKLGLDFSGMNNFPSDGNVGSGYSPDYDKLLKGIGDDTGSIADSMELTNEDLEYLRRIADMEWKKEFTTAEIKVEMNNANTINGESDLDGIVTKLTDKLYEELSAVADGVYS